MKEQDENNHSTVYGELKLSEKLSIEMMAIKGEKNSMLERIECLKNES